MIQGVRVPNSTVYIAALTWRFLSTVLLVLDCKIDFPSLKVDNNEKDEDCGQQVCQVGKILTVEGLFECLNLVLSGDNEMKEGNDGSFKLGSTSRHDCSWRKGCPRDIFTHIGGHKQINARTQTIAFLHRPGSENVSI
jgi:hypothetical protein